MSIALSLGNNLTTGGVFKADAVNNTSCDNITDFAGVAGGATLVLLSTQTASASSSISFTTGIDSTYDEYVFKIINCHPSTSPVYFQFNLSTDGGSNYNVTKTSSSFYTRLNEDGSSREFNYDGACDLGQETGYQNLGENIGSDTDHNISGYVHLYKPSSTTYIKHYLASTSISQVTPANIKWDIGGYGNTTSAINAIDFKFSSGNIDDGIIKMYGVKKS